MRLGQPQHTESGLPASEPAAPAVLGLYIEVTRYRLMQQRCACAKAGSEPTRLPTRSQGFGMA